MGERGRGGEGARGRGGEGARGRETNKLTIDTQSVAMVSN